MIIFHLRLGRPGVVALGREDQRRGGVIDIVAHVGEHLAALEQPIGVEGAAEQRLAILARYLGIAGSLGLPVIDQPPPRAIGGEAVGAAEGMFVLALEIAGGRTPATPVAIPVATSSRT